MATHCIHLKRHRKLGFFFPSLKRPRGKKQQHKETDSDTIKDIQSIITTTAPLVPQNIKVLCLMRLQTNKSPFLLSFVVALPVIVYKQQQSQFVFTYQWIQNAPLFYKSFYLKPRKQMKNDSNPLKWDKLFKLVTSGEIASPITNVKHHHQASAFFKIHK